MFTLFSILAVAFIVVACSRTVVLPPVYSRATGVYAARREIAARWAAEQRWV